MMRRILLALILVAIITSSANVFALNALMLSPPPFKTVTYTNVSLNISAVAGTAFITNVSPNITFPVNRTVTITKDASSAVGFIKAVGTGEGLGSDLLSGWDFTSGWSTLSAGSVVDASTYSSTSAGGIYKFISTNAVLHKLIYARTTSATLADSYNGIDLSRILLGTGSGTFYYTGRGTASDVLSLYLRNSTSGSTNVTNLKLYQVLTPSTSGATISLSRGSGAQTWTSQSTNFNYNATSYTVTISP